MIERIVCPFRAKVIHEVCFLLLCFLAGTISVKWISGPGPSECDVDIPTQVSNSGSLVVPSSVDWIWVSLTD